MANWADTATGHHCNRHDFSFPRGEVCHRCVTDPGKLIDVTDGDSNEHDTTLIAWESEIESMARSCYRVGAQLAMMNDHSVGAKWIAEGTKAFRAACDLREKRAQREHDRMLVRHRREMAGLSRKKGN